MTLILYINLASRPDRRDYMEGQLASLGLTGERVEAVTPADLSESEIEQYCDLSKARYLRKTELSCTKSHERAWETLIASGKERALILEDDAHLSPLLPEFIEETADLNADLIRIETSIRAVRLFPAKISTPSGVELHRFRSRPMGTAGYIITAAAASRLLGHPLFRQTQVDMALYDPFQMPGSGLNRFIASPALCTQLGDGHLPSPTEGLGRSDMDEAGQNAFMKKHPIRFRWQKFWVGLPWGIRNAVDDLASRRKGLMRKHIQFAGGASTQPQPAADVAHGEA